MVIISLNICIFRKDQFASYRTNKYKLNYYETPSGLKFIMNTDLSVGNIRDIMKTIYRKVNEPVEPDDCKHLLLE